MKFTSLRDTLALLGGRRLQGMRQLLVSNRPRWSLSCEAPRCARSPRHQAAPHPEPREAWECAFRVHGPPPWCCRLPAWPRAPEPLRGTLSSAGGLLCLQQPLLSSGAPPGVRMGTLCTCRLQNISVAGDLLSCTCGTLGTSVPTDPKQQVLMSSICEINCEEWPCMSHQGAARTSSGVP